MSQSTQPGTTSSGTHRILSVVVLLLAIIFGAGAASLYPLLFPKPAPVLRSAWQVFPVPAQLSAPACKQVFLAAFRAAGFTNISTEPPDGLQVQAFDNGYSAVGICMPRREAAAVVVTGIDVTVVDTRLDIISTRVMARQPAGQPSAQPAAPPQAQQQR